MTYNIFYFSSEYNPTVQDNFSKTTKIGDKEIGLDIFEACSDDEYDKVRSSSYPGAQVVLICFSVVNNSSCKKTSNTTMKR